MSSLLVHALSLLTLLFPNYSLIFFLFVFPLCFSLLSISLFVFYVSCRSSLLLFYYARLKPFYIAFHGQIYRFTHQPLLTCCGCHSQTTHQFVSCPATTTALCWLRHIPFPNKWNFFIYFLDICGIPIQIRVGYSLILTLTACTQ